MFGSAHIEEKIDTRENPKGTLDLSWGTYRYDLNSILNTQFPTPTKSVMRETTTITSSALFFAYNSNCLHEIL